MGYVTGGTIRILREKRKLTQKELAEIIHVSDKTISKWETDKGLPDISMIDELARAPRAFSHSPAMTTPSVPFSFPHYSYLVSFGAPVRTSRWLDRSS